MEVLTDRKEYDFSLLPLSVRNAVMKKEQLCPLCEDKGQIKLRCKLTPEEAAHGRNAYFFSVDKDNVTYENMPCRCKFYKDYWSIFAGTVPVHYHYVSLHGLQPSEQSDLPLSQQQSLYDDLRKNPNASYAFFGPAMFGKTTMSVALYRWAVQSSLQDWWKLPLNISYRAATGHPWKNFGVWRVSAKQLLEDFVREARQDKDAEGKDIHPVVDRAHIVYVRQKLGLTPKVFIEEIDKVRYTEFKMNALWELFDAIHENAGQLVFNTNLTPQQFLDQFKDLGASSVICDAFFWRMKRNMEVKDFFLPQRVELQ